MNRRLLSWMGWRVLGLCLGACGLTARALHPASPTLHVISPSPAEVLQARRGVPTDVLVIVYLTESDHGAVQGVEIRGDNALLGIAERSSHTPGEFDLIYRYLWRDIAPGEHVIEARGIGEPGFTLPVSVPVRFVVKAPANSPPEIQLALQERAVWFTPGNLPLKALAHDADGFVATVEFFAGAQSLGVVTNKCPFCENFPHVFDLVWTNPPVGMPIITALATDDAGASTRSEPVTVTVKPEPLPAVPVVTVQTRDAEALEADRDPATFRFDASWLGVFAVSRSGNLEGELQVFFEIGGSATRGKDYQLHPEGLGPCEFPCRRADFFIEGNSVLIPAGQASTEVLVRGLPDQEVEGPESVVFRITEDPSLGPVPRYWVGSPATAELFVVDPGPPEPRVRLAEPLNGAIYPAGATVRLTAVAEDPPHLATELEFLVNGLPLHMSGVVMDCACPNGAPVTHSFDWLKVPPGEFFLEARIRSSGGKVITSPVVRVTIQPAPNAPPSLQFVTPLPDAFIQPGQAVPVALSGYLPGNVLSVAEVFAEGVPIGLATDCCPACDCLAPQPGKPSWLRLWSTWTPGPGRHVLTARSLNSDGSGWVASSVEILVGAPTDQASVVITRPAERTLFGASTPVLVEVATLDPADHIPLVEFFADGSKLGESRVVFIREPDPGTPIAHSWTWFRPPLGVHTLTVRGTNSRGKQYEGLVPVTVTIGQALNLALHLELDRKGRAQFVLPDGSLAGHGFDLYETLDLKTWRRLGAFSPGNVAAFFELELDGTDSRPRFFRARPAEVP